MPPKTILKWRPFAILNFIKSHIWPRECHRVSYLHLCTKWWNMTISRFSRWQISAILNFMGPIMGSLKSPCRTSYRSSVETIALNCLVLLENRIFVRMLSTDGRTDRRTDGQPRGDALTCSRCREQQLNKWYVS